MEARYSKVTFSISSLQATQTHRFFRYPVMELRCGSDAFGPACVVPAVLLDVVAAASLLPFVVILLVSLFSASGVFIDFDSRICRM